MPTAVTYRRNNNMDDINPTGRLPDFIFSRRRDIELECGLTLAGMLVTDIPTGRKLSKSDGRLVQHIISQLRERVKSAPDLTNAGIWRTGLKPADGLSPPFDDRLLEERCRRCICIMVTSGTESVVKVPSDLLRQIMMDGGNCDVKFQ